METKKLFAEALTDRDLKALNLILDEKLANGELIANQTPIAFLQKDMTYHLASEKNALLAKLQNPNYSMLASFKRWGEVFNRRVKKGEKACYLFIPRVIKKKDAKNDDDSFVKFRLVPFFDISQTEAIDGRAVVEIPDIKDVTPENLMIG